MRVLLVDCRKLHVIALFHNDFPLAVSNPNTVHLLMSYNNKLPVV